MLGGTSEASRLAGLLAGAGMNAIFSYAGRTDAPRAQPLPMRVGGFGGVAGLSDYLRQQEISHVIDATHPFAAQISRNAMLACERAGVDLLILQRRAWRAGDGDNWTMVADYDSAAAALPDGGARVFLAIGKQNLQPFASRANRYLLRLVDAPQGPLPLPNAEAVIARGPFTPEDDFDLLTRHRVTHLVAKNSGGSGAEAKLIAARQLGLPVVMIDRPALSARRIVHRPEDALDWLHHSTSA